MKPVLVLQHQHNDGPAFLATWLAGQGVALELRNTEAGQDFPDSIAGFAALAILGGEMSANDPLPALRRVEALVVQAVQRGVPVLGHCLGGQLMARALGAPVTVSPAPEVGWHPIDLLPGASTQAWFGDAAQLTVFQWHGEAFGLPAGATRLAANAHCPNQAFAIGPHLAMQFHIEIDQSKLVRWAAETSPAYHADQRRWPSVHAGERMLREAHEALPAQQRAAARVYARWLSAAG